MKPVLQVLKQTINDNGVMGSDNLRKLFTWVNAAYGLHPDLKIHIGGGMSFGYGLVHFNKSKQKVNTKSSTEAELVGIID